MLRSKLRSALLGAGTAAAVVGTALAPATATAAPAPQDVSPSYLSCTVPRGYTYTSVSLTTTCSTSGLSPLYNVVTPRTGLWACTVPAGFTYTSVSSTIVCTTSGMGNIYLLRAI
ncbi:hypothetical protein [Streptomyces litchfieldiae]|uniref:Ig-like domain-containing protein n=1 Tax=Streptomyces litchfieldiae TaxID=3075543 RepID=A0ABU2MS57_9ACTN|nr:hypothetical protein [Streptomyces sp. DSM 44938]MDT0344466.1 hypothetical protein [Streptomyces sp. DSM 44938]